MEFYEAVERRRTARQFLQKEVDFEAVKRILEAGNRAPTWDHNRSWQYILLRTDEEKEYAFAEAKKIAEKFDAERYLHMPRAYPITLGQKMYGYAMPRQFSMLKSAPYVVIPVCRAKQLQGEGVSHLNPFATIWCVIENILLAAAARRALIRGICRSAAGAYSRRAPIRSIRLFEPRAFYKSKKIVKRGRIPIGGCALACSFVRLPQRGCR